MKPFHFKHFSVQQSNAALKVGTDAMLLGSLCDFTGARSILDIGTGTGVLALMTAQRFAPETITAIEIDPSAITDAAANFSSSPFQSELELIHGDIRKAAPERKFDGIITNPPYFENSTKSTGKEKKTARHTDELSYKELLGACSILLNDTGIVYMILPYEKAGDITRIALESGLHLSHNITIHGKPGKPVRSILSFRKAVTAIHESVFIIRNDDGAYTPEYIKLTADFHGVDLSR